MSAGLGCNFPCLVYVRAVLELLALQLHRWQGHQMMMRTACKHEQKLSLQKAAASGSPVGSRDSGQANATGTAALLSASEPFAEKMPGDTCAAGASTSGEVAKSYAGK